jgi:hypothetical protein
MEASEGLAFKIWFKRAVDVVAATSGDDEGKGATDVTDDEAKGKKAASKAGADATEDSFESLAPSVQADLLAQNAKRTSQVGYLNAALHLGTWSTWSAVTTLLL